MDLTGIQGAINTVDSKTIPELLDAANKLIDRLEGLINRLDGATLTVTLHLGAPK